MAGRTIYEAERMTDMSFGCGDGGTSGYFVRGHVSKLDLLCAIVYTGYWVNGRNLKVRQVYWREVPASIYDPEWEPCEMGDEPFIYDECRADRPGAYAVTVLDI